MKTKLAAISYLVSSIGLSAFAQGTAFTYQGRLNDGANPANGNYDLRFTIYDSSANGNQVGNLLTNTATAVSNGLFTVTLDFGNQFPGAGRWLEIGVRTNGSASAYTTLSPRQPLTPAPYAITASNLTGTLPAAQLSGPVASGNLSGAYGNAVTLNNAANQLSGSFTGNGANVTNVSASSLGGLASSNFWQVGGNSVTSSQFLGTLNTQPLDFRANGLRALRLELTGNGAPNVIGGSPENSVGAGVTGAFIGGGGATNSIYTSTFSSTNRIASDLAVICGGTANLIGPGAPLSTIAGGLENTISNTSESTIGGGALNLISGGSQSTIAGGVRNTLILQADGFVGGVVNQLGGSDSRNLFFPRQTNWDNAISGGAANLITLGANDCFIGGGYFNTISNAGYGTIVGGLSNVVAGDYAFAAGRRAQALHDGAFVWEDSQNADFSSTGTDQFLIRAAGGVGIGTGAPASELHVVSSSSDCEISIQSGDTGNHRWTLQSSGNGTPGIPVHSFQVIDRTLGKSRMLIDTNGSVYFNFGGGSDQSVFWTIGTGSWNFSSDRNLKDRFAPVDPQAVLDKVSQLPIAEWSYKGAASGTSAPWRRIFMCCFRSMTTTKR